MRTLAPLALALSLPLALVAACGGSNPSSSTSTTAGSGGATSSSSSSSSTTASSSSTGGAGGAGGAGGTGGCVDMGPQTTTFVPTPADIQFEALAPLPSGELILFNDWAATPNTVSAVTVDGATTTKVFEAYRVWSMGVARAAGTIAFSCGDPDQETHYGVNIGDAIQHTWLYDVASQKATLLADGNINDECHTFGPGDTKLYVCRRYDFTNCGDDKGYRIGVIDLSSKMFSFLDAGDANAMTLDPAPTLDGASLLFTHITLSGANQQDDIDQEPLTSTTASTLRATAGTPVLSPDGTRYAYHDYTDQGRLWVSKLDGSGAVRVAPERGDNAAWSPDGTRIAYLGSDQAAGCQPIEIVQADGSTADTPTKLRDCATTGEFITQLAWIKRP